MSLAGVADLPALLATAIQNVVQTRSGKVLASLVVMLGFLAVVLQIRRLGPLLKDRYDADNVEAFQAVLVSICAALTGALLVVLWRAIDEVWASLDVIRFGPRQGALALVGGLTLIVAYTLTRVSKGLLEADGEHVITAHRREALHHIIQLVVYIAAAMFILSLGGVNPTDLLVGAGALGLIVGLAARQTLGSILAGLVLLFARPLEVGDWVVIDDREGVVTDVTLFNTELRTWDDEHVMIPNDQVASSSIVNRSRSGRLRVTVEVGVDYDADVTRAAELATEAMEECDVEPLMSTPAPGVVGREFGDSAITLECRFWISDPSARRLWETKTAVIRMVKNRYDEAGVKIPYPQRELMAREEADGFRLASDRAVVEQSVADGQNGDGQ